MVHSIFDGKNDSEITIDDGYFEKLITINIYDKVDNINATHYLNKKDLHDFIGILLHVQSKMRK